MIGGRRCSEAARRLRRRPDTLELSVLGGQPMETELQEEDDERTPATGTGNAVESGTKSAEATSKRTRWFQFARSSKNLYICTFYIHDHTDHNYISPDQIAKAYLTSSVGSLIPLFPNTIIVRQSN